MRPYDDIKVGERAVTIGTPQGLELTVAEGIVSSKRTFNQSRVIRTSAPISQGSSGGRLFDARGHLLGITTFYFKAGQNLNFAVAAEEFAQDRDETAISVDRSTVQPLDDAPSIRRDSEMGANQCKPALPVPTRTTSSGSFAKRAWSTTWKPVAASFSPDLRVDVIW